MSRRNLSPVDIAGITLGVIVILVVVGSVTLLTRQRLSAFGWYPPDWSSWDTDGFQDWKPGAPGQVREEKDESFAGAITEVEIRNVAGSISFRGSMSNALTVHSVKTAVFPGALEHVRVEVQRNGSRILLEEKHDGGFMRSAGTIAFDVTVPPGVKSIVARSVSGSITVDGVKPGTRQDITTVSGSISTNGSGDLHASSTSGSVTFVFGGRDLDVRTISGSIEGKIQSLSGDGTARMHSISGSVDVDAFAALEGAVSLHSLSGGVSCDFPLAVADQKRNSLEGRIGTGKARLEVTTTSGPITVRRM